ncbi:MAG: Ig-like domain-containing protein [Lachnospiraceae bacterium]|nr:Ig-like domain-containing protein [Lachnospiraceae bacterium]
MKRKILIYIMILSIIMGNGMYFNLSISEAADNDLNSICVDQVYSFSFRTDFYLTCSIKSNKSSIVDASVKHGSLNSNQVMITLTGISEGTAEVELYAGALTLKTFTVNVVKHSELTFVEGKDATCTEDGYKEYYVCDQCGNAFSDEEGNDILAADDYMISATGHTIEQLEYMLPTFDSAGHISYYHCNVCDAGFSDPKGELELPPHSYVLPQLDSNSVLASGITLNISQLKLFIGESADVNATINPTTSSFPLKITSSDKNVAILNDTGKIYAVSSGTCDIMFETINGISAVCKVTVEEKPEVSNTLKITSVSMNHKNASLNLSTSDNNLFNQTVTIYAKDENRQIIGTCTTSFTKSSSSAYMDFCRIVECGEKIEFYAQKPDESLSPSVIEKKAACGTKSTGKYSVGPDGATGYSEKLKGIGGTVTVNVSGKNYTSVIDEQGFWYVDFDTPVMEGLEVIIQEKCHAGCEFQERIEKCVISDIEDDFRYIPVVYTSYVCLDSDYFTPDKVACLYYNGKEYILPDTPSKATINYSYYYLPEQLKADSYVSIVIKNRYTGIVLMDYDRKVKSQFLDMSTPIYYENANQISFSVYDDGDFKITIYYSINDKTYTQKIMGSGTLHNVSIPLSEKYENGTIVYIWLEDETGYSTSKMTCNISYTNIGNNNGDNDNSNNNSENNNNSSDGNISNNDDDEDDEDWDIDQPKPEEYATKLKVSKKISIAVGTKRKISVRRAKSNTKMPKLKWKSSNKKIATVNSSGQVSARKIGKCKISCIIQNGKGKGKKYTCTVRVRKNTWTGYTKSELNVFGYRYGQVYLEVAKVYYSGNNLIVKCVVLNNRMFPAQKFANLKLKILTEDHTLIAKRTFWNYPLNLGKYSKKYVTFTFPKKYQKAKKDLSYYGVDIDYDYTYVYTIK